MLGIQKVNIIDFVQLVVVEDFDIFFPQQIQVNLMGIIPDSHNEGSFCI